MGIVFRLNAKEWGVLTAPVGFTSTKEKERIPSSQNHSLGTQVKPKRQYERHPRVNELVVAWYRNDSGTALHPQSSGQRTHYLPEARYRPLSNRSRDK